MMWQLSELAHQCFSCLEKLNLWEWKWFFLGKVQTKSLEVTCTSTRRLTRRSFTKKHVKRYPHSTFFSFLCQIIVCMQNCWIPLYYRVIIWHFVILQQIKSLHLYDCLRANKSTSAWGLEARVPFLDKEFINVAMSIDPEWKLVSHLLTLVVHFVFTVLTSRAVQI